MPAPQNPDTAVRDVLLQAGVMLVLAAALPLIQRATSDPDFLTVTRLRLALWRERTWPTHKDDIELAVIAISGVYEAQRYLDRVWKRSYRKEESS